MKNDSFLLGTSMLRSRLRCLVGASIVCFFSLCCSFELPDLDDDLLKEISKKEVPRTLDEAPASIALYELVSPVCAWSDDVDLLLEIPYFGTILFRSIKTVGGKEGVEGIVTFPPQPIVIGPLTIHNKGTFTFVEGVIAFTGKATLDLGYKKFEATVGLRELKLAGKERQVDDPKTGSRKITRLVDSCIFGMEIVGSGSELELIPGVPLSAKSFDLIIKKGKPPAITLSGFVGKAPSTISTVLDLKKKTLRLEGSQSQCPLIDIAPFLKNTLLENFSFDGDWHITAGGEANFEGRLYGKTPQEKALIEPFPGVSASLDRIILSIRPDRFARITVKTTFLGMAIDYVGNYDAQKNELELKGVLQKVRLTDLLPVFSDTDFKNIVFDGTVLLSTGSGLVVKGALRDEIQTVSLYGMALRKIAINLDTSKKMGTIIGVADLLGLPVSASFGIGWGKQTGAVFSAGIAEGVTSWQPFIRVPRGDEKLEFLRTLTVENPKARVSLGLAGGAPEKEKQVKSPLKKGEKKSQEKQDEVYLVIDELRKKGTHINVTVAGTVSAGKFLADAVKEVGKVANLPPAIINLVQPKDLELAALFKFGFSHAQTINAVGFLDIPEGFTLTDLLPSEDLFKKSLGVDRGMLLYKLLNLVRMDYGKLVVSLSDEEIDGVKYSTGLSIDTNISIADAIQKAALEKLPFLKGILEKKGTRGAGLRFFLTFDPFNLKNFAMKIGLSTGDLTLSIPKIVQPPAPATPVIDIGPYDFSRLTIDFVVRGDGVGLSGGFAFLPHEHPNQKPIYCSGELKATATALSGEISTDQDAVWRNPFGIEKLFRGGFTIGRLGFKISELYENFTAIPETFGLSLLAVGAIGVSGEVTLGKTKPLSLSVFFKLGADLLDFAFEAGVKNVETIFDLLQGLLEGLGIAGKLPIDLNKFALGKLSEASLKITPFGGNIGDVKVTAGLGGALIGEILGMPLGALLMIDGSGIKLHGYLPDIRIGPLVITKAPDVEARKKGVADPQEIKDAIQKYFADRTPAKVGPEVEFVLSLKEVPRLRINGDVRLDMSAGNSLVRAFTDIEVSKDRLAFEIDDYIGPQWAGLRARIKASTIHLTGPLQLLKDIQPKNLNLEVEFTNTLSDAILKAISAIKPDNKGIIAGLLQNLLPYIEKIVKLINIKRIYWKGDLDSFSKGRISGIVADIDINGKEYRGNLGDLDFTSPGEFNWSVAQIGINLLRIGGSILQEFLGITVFIPPCAPSVLVEFQNQRQDLEVSVTDKRDNIKTGVMWWRTKGYKGYEVVDVLCQHKPQPVDVVEKTPAWLGLQPKISTIPDTVNTYTVTVNKKPVLEITSSFSALRPDGTETIEAELYKIEPSGAKTRIDAQRDYGEKVFDIEVPGVPPFAFKWAILREFNQAKIKGYVQEVYDRCPVKAFVEGVNQRRDLDVLVVSAGGKRVQIPESGVKSWVPIDGICRSETAAVSSNYTVVIRGVQVANVICEFGSSKNEYMQVTIAKATGISGPDRVATPQFKGALGGDAVTADLALADGTRFAIKAEVIREGVPAQSKFKIYIQETICSPNAWVEVINQQKVKLVVKDLDTQATYDIPDWGTRGWTSLPMLCYPKSGALQKDYLLTVNGTPLAAVRCLLFADGKMATHIRTPDDKTCLRDSQGKTPSIKHNFGSYTVGTEVTQQLTGLTQQSKFKIYLQDKSWQGQGPTC